MRFLAALAALLVLPLSAQAWWHHGSVGPATPGIYAQWSNFPQSPTLVPMGLFYTAAINNIDTACYSSVANPTPVCPTYSGDGNPTAAAATGINFWVGLPATTPPWPGNPGCAFPCTTPVDNGQAALIQGAGLYMIGGSVMMRDGSIAETVSNAIGTVAATGSSYNSTTGHVTLALTAPATIVVGNQFNVSGLTGTGSDLGLADVADATALAGSGGSTLIYAIATGKNITSITGGSLGFYTVTVSPNAITTVGGPLAQQYVMASCGGCSVSALTGYNGGDEPGTGNGTSAPNLSYPGLCGPTAPGNLPFTGPPYTNLTNNILATFKGYDTTRPVLYNVSRWFVGSSCQSPAPPLGSGVTASGFQQAVSIASYDDYPQESKNDQATSQFQFWLTQFSTKSDFNTFASDYVWMHGVITQAFKLNLQATQPAWIAIAPGTNLIGSQLDFLWKAGTETAAAVVVNGSTKLLNNTGWSIFTPLWTTGSLSGGGMTLIGSGLASGTTVVSILSPVPVGSPDGCTNGVPNLISPGVAGCSELTMSNPWTLASSSTALIQVAGGMPASGDTSSSPHTDCVESVNVCLVYGNEPREYASEVNAEVWSSFINGANGIEYFPNDVMSSVFSLGDVASGTVTALGFCTPDCAKAQTEQAIANATAANVAMINAGVKLWGGILNASTVGICSMDQWNPAIPTSNSAVTVNTFCTNGVLRIDRHTGTIIPAAGIVKTYHGNLYVIIQISRRGIGSYDITISGLGASAHVATVMYDSLCQYDSAFAASTVTTFAGCTAGSGTGTFSLTAGQWTDTFGQGSNPSPPGDPLDYYQTKIYLIQ